TGQNLKTGFVITDGGPHLPKGAGLLVWTTATTVCFFYAVTTSNDHTISQINSLPYCIAEAHQAVSPQLTLKTFTKSSMSGRTAKHYYAWEDYSTWDHSEWAYYGHSFVVLLPASESGPYEMDLDLHSAGCGFDEPLISVSSVPPNAVILAPRDLCLPTDPY